MIIAGVLFVVLLLVRNLLTVKIFDKYRNAIGVPDEEFEYVDAEKVAAELLLAIDEDERKRHKDDILRVNHGKEFKYYIEEARRNDAGFSLVVYLAHMTGCEVVLRKVSEEDIEAEYNRDDVFWEHLCSEKGVFDDDKSYEYSLILKSKRR